MKTNNIMNTIFKNNLVIPNILLGITKLFLKIVFIILFV